MHPGVHEKFLGVHEIVGVNEGVHEIEKGERRGERKPGVNEKKSLAFSLFSHRIQQLLCCDGVSYACGTHMELIFS